MSPLSCVCFFLPLENIAYIAKYLYYNKYLEYFSETLNFHIVGVLKSISATIICNFSPALLEYSTKID